MDLTNAILNYRRFIKRKNYSACTVKNYMSTLRQFILWIDVPVEQVSNKKLLSYIDHLLSRRLSPKTINCHLDSIRGFYNYLIDEEQVQMVSPVKRGYVLRLSKPLPRYLRDEDVIQLFSVIKNRRDRAIFMLMLRCGLRVEEVAKLTMSAIDFVRSQLFIFEGKGRKGRIVYLSQDAKTALEDYLNARPSCRTKRVFLVEERPHREQPISVRGIQKRMEHYARKAGLKASCHQLRHTMATQLLNADADLVSIQDLLGHTRIKTTQRYCKVSNLKVQRDYHHAIEKVIERQGSLPGCGGAPPTSLSMNPFSSRRQTGVSSESGTPADVI
jgi:site-specific recombinase XerD